MMAKTSQLDLFASADECRQLQAENAWLKTRLDNAKTAFRKLREELQQCQAGKQAATHECERLAGELKWTKLVCDVLQAQVDCYTPGQDGAAPTRGEVTKLLTLCHPDRWAQGQPASELAHEVTVRLNSWRSRMGVQL